MLHLKAPNYSVLCPCFLLPCCDSNQILHPEVPHSLRLQGILVGGVVVLYNKQQVYLLEDVQDMVVSVT